MNRKGFTLIELLVSIVIMTLILIMVMPSITALKENNEEKQYEYYGKSLVEAAKLFVDKEGDDINSMGAKNWTGCVDITYDDLLSADLIKPFNDENIDCSNAIVRYTKTDKKSSYAYNLVCKDLKSNKTVFNHEEITSGECGIIDTDDRIPPTCGSAIGESTEWTRENREITISCSDRNGCEDVTKVFDKTTKVGTITVKDGNGNKTNCPVNVYVDKNEPTLSVNLKKKNSSYDLDDSSDISSLADYTNDSWYNGYVVLRGNCSDNSKCTVSYKVTGASSNTDGFVEGNTVNINAEGTSTVEFRATDEVGNTTTNTYTVKLDRIRPTIKYSVSGGTYKQSSLKVCATASDNVEINKMRMEVYKSSSRISLTDKKTTSICYTLSGFGSYTIYTKVYDTANNKQKMSPENVNGFYYQSYTLSNPDPDINFKLSCKRVCAGNCSLNGYNNDRIWGWYISGAGSGIKSASIDYSTSTRPHYWTATVTSYGAKVVKKTGGYGYFELPTQFRFSRSYAKSNIVGTACTKTNKCKSCTLYN